MLTSLHRACISKISVRNANPPLLHYFNSDPYLIATRRHAPNMQDMPMPLNVIIELSSRYVARGKNINLVAIRNARGLGDWLYSRFRYLCLFSWRYCLIMMELSWLCYAYVHELCFIINVYGQSWFFVKNIFDSVPEEILVVPGPFSTNCIPL
jgi:hypothetical protein